jgi:hypothetical protein
MKVFLIILIFLLQSFPSSAKVGDVYVCNLKKGFAFMGKDFNDLFDSPLPKHRENAKTKLVWLEKSINEEKNKFFQILLYDCSDIFKK